MDIFQLLSKTRKLSVQVNQKSPYSLGVVLTKVY